jgi:glutamine cyclotransferase
MSFAIAAAPLSAECMPVPLSGYESVLNGIAYDAKHDKFFVTGKQWPTVFEIEIVSRPPEKYEFR